MTILAVLLAIATHHIGLARDALFITRKRTTPGYPRVECVERCEVKLDEALLLQTVLLRPLSELQNAGRTRSRPVSRMLERFVCSRFATHGVSEWKSTLFSVQALLKCVA